MNHDKGIGGAVGLGFFDQFWKGKRAPVQLWLPCVEKKLLIKGRDQDVIGPNSPAQAFQRRQRGLAVLVGAGKRFLKCMIARENGGRSRDLLVTLLDQLIENSGARAETGFDLGEGMVPIGLADNEIGRALQQRQEGNQEKEQPAAETAESKFQR
jgi:hypothetical protein